MKVINWWLSGLLRVAESSCVVFCSVYDKRMSDCVKAVIEQGASLPRRSRTRTTTITIGEQAKAKTVIDALPRDPGSPAINEH